MNLTDFLARAGDQHGRRRAVALGDQGLRHAELNALSGRTAALLAARGVVPGDRVGLMLASLPNSLSSTTVRCGPVPSWCR